MNTFTYDKYTFVSSKININNVHGLYHLSIRPPMSDEDYDALKYRIERLGGHWRERYGGFILNEDPIPLLMKKETWQEIVHEEYDLWRINRQFYPTPPSVAERVISLCEIRDTDIVLEPSAGRGALIKPIRHRENVIAVEIDEGLSQELQADGFTTINMSFEDAVANNKVPLVDRIVMNPPFSGQRDIKHILMAYELLKPNGVLVAIMAENDLFYKTQLTKDFNKFLMDKGAYIEAVPMRAFCVSDTFIDTVIVKIRK